MHNALKFKDKLMAATVPLGTVIGSLDPCVTEALAYDLDFVWIDMEHSALTIESVQAHLMATKGTDCAALVRVRWNDPALIKPVLDAGGDGIIVPMVCNEEEAKRAVEACLYPPRGVRGFGPRRPSKFGRLGGPEFCKSADNALAIIVQIEHVEAVKNIDAILQVAGLTSCVIGANDLAGSMGYPGEPTHPKVIAAIENVIDAAHRSRVFVGIGTGNDSTVIADWVKKGVQWVAIGNDYGHIIRSFKQVADGVRAFVTQTAISDGRDGNIPCPHLK